MVKFEVYESKDDKYRWRLKAANGEIVAVSQGYATKSNARRSAENVQSLAPRAIITDI
jgi:uncharacterized protein YegP (UPF0339 family)